MSLPFQLGTESSWVLGDTSIPRSHVPCHVLPETGSNSDVALGQNKLADIWQILRSRQKERHISYEDRDIPVEQHDTLDSAPKETPMYHVTLHQMRDFKSMYKKDFAEYVEKSSWVPYDLIAKNQPNVYNYSMSKKGQRNFVWAKEFSLNHPGGTERFVVNGTEYINMDNYFKEYIQPTQTLLNMNQKKEAMKKGVQAFLNKNPEIKKLLMSTSSRPLMYFTNEHDKWGKHWVQYGGTADNWLGDIYSEIRSDRKSIPQDEMECWDTWCPEGKTKDDWKSCYRKEARKWHPDKNRDPEAPDKFKALSACDELIRPGRY